MTPRTRILAAASGVLLLIAAAYAFHSWQVSGPDPREQLLDRMPPAADAVIYADLADLRQTPFLKELDNWAPHPEEDPDYAQFVRDTGFHYERDLDRIAIAVEPQGGARRFFAIADGRFDQKKIAAYALLTGRKESRNGRDVYTVPSSEGNSAMMFTFLTDRRIALTDDGDIGEQLGAQNGQGSAEWRARFERLAGSPLFALIRQNASAADAIANQAPGGFRSPQLAALLDRLQWISIAGKPSGEHLQVVVEGESTDEQTTRQLSDFLSGALLLAEAGLDGARVRAQLDPQTRAAYLELMKSADVSKVDRGDTKSVRVVLDVSPAVLKLARNTPLENNEPPAKQPSSAAAGKDSPGKTKSARKR